MFNELMIVKVFKSRIFRITNWTMSSLINVLLNISMVRSFFFKLYSFNIHSLKVGHGDWLIPDDTPLTLSKFNIIINMFNSHYQTYWIHIENALNKCQIFTNLGIRNTFNFPISL
jgi:hypothetical protein